MFESWNAYRPSFWARLCVLGYDTAAAGVALTLAVWYGAGQNSDWLAAVWRTNFALPTILLCTIASIVVAWTKQHRAVWRYTSITELSDLLRNASLTLLIFLPFLFFLSRGTELTRLSLVLTWVFMIGIMVTPRLIARIMFRRSVTNLSREAAASPKILSLVWGVGPRAQAFVTAIAKEPKSVYRVLGFMASGHEERGTWRAIATAHALPVYGGGPAELAIVLRQLRAENIIVRRLILTEPVSQEQLNSILEVAADFGLILGRFPDTHDGPSDAQNFTVLPVDVEDLILPKKQSLIGPAQMELLRGKRVLVTGAGGSIGAEIVRQAAACDPARLALMEKSEFALYTIDHELNETPRPPVHETILCDVRDRVAVERWFAAFRPEIVFHAAGLKHVPMIEAHPLEGILTNVDGTRNVADAAQKFGATVMVLVSSDKAVNPKSVMGATKRLAEAYCQALDLRTVAPGERQTRFVTVRFGNVLWSNGSVVSLFRRQIAAGGPLTVTHPDVTRYFMTIREAAQLILKAGTLAVRGRLAKGGIVVMDMGAQVRIANLARQMIRLAGRRPDIDVKIQYMGLRPGEKLEEELLHPDEERAQLPEAGLTLALPRAADLQLLRRNIDVLTGFARKGEVDGAIAALRHFVPEFEPGAQNPRLRSMTGDS